MGNKLTVEFTEDLIKLVKLMSVMRFNDNQVGFDFYELYPQSHLFDFMATVLGLEEHRIKGTEESPMGAQYDEETTKKLIELDEYIVDNFEYIEEIVHQFCDVGIKPGKYSCLAYQRIWKYDEKKKTAQ